MTIKELRGLIAANEGCLQIGALKFKAEDDKDIDIYFSGDLLQWFNRSCDGEDGTDNESFYTVSADFRSIKNQIDSVKTELAKSQEENENLKTTNTALSSTIADVQLSLGKVAAYERILFGREVNNLTISAPSEPSASD